MNRLLRPWWPLFFCLIAAGLMAAVAPVGRFFDTAGRSPGGTPLVIECDRGSELTTQQAIFRGNVRVFDPQFDLYCEVLTVRYTTNRANAAGAAVSRSTNAARIQGIVAETNVFLFTGNLMAFGDRAVYSATNETLVLYGNPAMVGTEQASQVSSMFVFERRADGVHFTAPGRSTTTLQDAGPGNFLNDTLRTNQPAPAVRQRPQP